MTVQDFLNRPIVKLNGFTITVLTIIVLALVVYFWRQYKKSR